MTSRIKNDLTITENAGPKKTPIKKSVSVTKTMTAHGVKLYKANILGLRYSILYFLILAFSWELKSRNFIPNKIIGKIPETLMTRQDKPLTLALLGFHQYFLYPLT